MSSPTVPGSGGTVVEAKLIAARFGAQFAIIVVVAFMVFAGIAGATLLLVLAPFVLLGAGLFFRESLVASFRWRSPELVLPAPGLELGGTVQVIYRRRPRRVRDIPSCRVGAELTCEEHVEYRLGTTTYTDSSAVFKRAFDGDGEGTVDGLQAVLTLRIPTHAGAPTLKLHNNEIRWHLRTRIEGSGLPKDEHRFDIQVVPVLASTEASTGVQDS